MNSKQSHALHCVPLIVPMIGAFVLLAGCASGPDSRVVSSPPPAAPGTSTAPTTVVVPANQAPQAVVANPTPTVIVHQAPPTMQSESPPQRPSERHVWVGGYWSWQHQRYVWIPGQWVLPPRVDATWVPPRWEQEGNGYRFYDGYWD